jgi:hypothetical protein
VSPDGPHTRPVLLTQAGGAEGGATSGLPLLLPTPPATLPARDAGTMRENHTLKVKNTHGDECRSSLLFPWRSDGCRLLVLSPILYKGRWQWPALPDQDEDGDDTGGYMDRGDSMNSAQGSADGDAFPAMRCVGC